MSHILLVTGDLRGIAGATIELGRRLAAVGHTVTVASPGRLDSHLLEDGLRTQQLPAFSASGFQYRGLAGRIPSSPRTRWWPPDRRRAAVALLPFAATEEVLTDLASDLVLVDIELVEHAAVAVATGHRVALLSTWINIMRGMHRPPLGSRTGAGDDRAARVRIAGEWIQTLAARAARLASVRARSRGIDRLAVLAAYGESCGMPLRFDPSQWLLPGVLTSLDQLVLTGSELDFPGPIPPGVHYVGPMVDERPTLIPLPDSIQGGEPSEAASSPVLYCSFGTWSESYDAGLIGRIFEAVGRHPEWRLIFASGGVDATIPTAVPPNVEVFADVPQFQVLRHADLALTHAGISTINECILAGTPCIAYPTGVRDQWGNASRVAFHGIGSIGDPTDDVDAIERRIEQGLADRATRAEVLAMRQRFAAYRAGGTAEAVVNRLLITHGGESFL